METIYKVILILAFLVFFAAMIPFIVIGLICWFVWTSILIGYMLGARFGDALSEFN